MSGFHGVSLNSEVVLSMEISTDLLVCWCECVVKWLFGRARRRGLCQLHFSLKFSHACCDHSLILSLSAWVEKKTCSFFPVVCRLPWEHSTCVNSVYQALFPPPAYKNLGMKICGHLTSSMTCCYGDAQKDFNNRWGAHITWALPEESTIF